MAVPSMAANDRHNSRCSSILPLMPTDIMRMKTETPIEIQIEVIARPMVVAGSLFPLRQRIAHHQATVAVMVTGQAR